MEVAAATGVKNPESIRLDYAVVILWILRCAQNDSHHFSITLSINPL